MLMTIKSYATILMLGLLYVVGIAYGATNDMALKAGRIELCLVAEDAKHTVGHPLHDFFNPGTTYGIEKILSRPGEFDRVSRGYDQYSGMPVLWIHIKRSAVERMNRQSGLVGRRLAIVLDGRSVLTVATVREKLAETFQISGASMKEIDSLFDTITKGQSRN